MKLKPEETPWCPARHPEYLCLLVNRQRPPTDLRSFQVRQVELLQRLVAEADEDEKEQGNLRLRQFLPEEALQFLPNDLLMNRRTPSYLINNQMVEGSPLHQWKWGYLEAAKLPAMPPAEARAAAEELVLENYLLQLL